MIRFIKKKQRKTGLAANWKKSSNKGRFALESSEIEDFRAFCFYCDVKMMLCFWLLLILHENLLQLKSPSEYVTIPLGLP